VRSGLAEENGPTPERSDRKAWNDRYLRGDTPWALGAPSPPLVEAVRRGRIQRGRVAIPGAGTGDEAVFLARRGFDVTAFDIAPAACAALRRKAEEAGTAVTVVCCDALSELNGGPCRAAFDCLFEQTFFCAIPPERRPEYVRMAHDLLKPGGMLFGVFFVFPGGEDGPPFTTDEGELRSLFEPAFEILRLERCEWSHPRRAGEELWAEFRKPAGGGG